ncbi:hypothetical protein R83H12_00570 [Fibrobacteria bacterium R8-3-H12]
MNAPKLTALFLAVFAIATHAQTAAALPYICDFEDLTERGNWVLENGTETNQWAFGTPAQNGGSYSLYISNDNGTLSYYNYNATSYVYAYRRINFTETGNHTISFNWKNAGEDSYDNFRAFLVPDNVTTITASNANGNSGGTNNVPLGWIAVSGVLSGQGSMWQSFSNKVNVPSTGTYKLVFFWKNDYTTGTNPPAAVDNIIVFRGDINASVLTHFGYLATPYTQPTAQTVTITNDGTATVTLVQPSSTNFIIGSLSTTSLAVGAKATFTVRPKAGLTVGTYSETIIINGSNGIIATVSANFNVAASEKIYYITGSGTSFSASKASAGGTPINANATNKTIQAVIDAIRIDANGDPITIKFGNGTNVLDIGTEYIAFNGSTSSPAWGHIGIAGKITSANTTSYGTIYINIPHSSYPSSSITSVADIANTSSGGRAVYNYSGEVFIYVGTVQASTAVYNSGLVLIDGGTVQASGTAVYNYGTVNISGGTVQATGSNGIAVMNYSTGVVNISGGEVKATGSEGNAVYNYSTGKITVYGSAKVTSANISSAGNGTISLNNSGTATGVRLEITGGTVENTAAGGNAVYNGSTGGILLSHNPTITGTIMKAGTGILSVNGSFEPSEGKTYKLGFSNFDGVAVAGGASNLSSFTLANSSINGFAMSLTEQGSDIVLTANGYAVEKNGTTYTITKGTGKYVYIQHAIDYIRTQANGMAVSIQFGNGTNVLNIGTEYITFNGSATSPAWGAITLEGKITSAHSYTIYLTNGASIASTADIANTYYSGSAVYNNSSGLVNISGGTVSATGSTGTAVYNASTGKITVYGNANVTSANTTSSSGTIYIANSGTTTTTRLEITGGTVENTATSVNGNAVYNASTGGILLSGDPTITRTIMKASTGVLSVDDYFEPTSGKTYKLGFTSYEGVAVKDGNGKDPYFSINSVNGITMSLSAQGNDLVIIVHGYAVEKNGTAYTITKGTGTYIFIQQAIDNIRTQANGEAVTIQFGNGTDVLDIGTEYITFDGSASLSPVWSAITLTGKITSASYSYYGTIYLTNGASIASTADIANTYSGGTAVNNASSGAVSISGGTVSATGNSGSAVYNYSTGKIAVSGSANVTSANTTSSNGTIVIQSYGSATETRLEIIGGTVENTAANGNAVHNSSTGGILLSGNPAITGTIMKASTGILSVDDDFEPTSGKTYKLGFSSVNVVSVAVAGGASKSQYFYLASVPILNGFTLGLSAQGSDLVIAATDGYKVANNGTTYTITKGTGNNIYIQDAIDYIRTQANGSVATIQFGDGTDVLDIGTEYITFDGTATPAWGTITLEGKITSINSSRTIYLINGASIASTADIANTYSGGTAVYNNGAGTVNISSGTVSATTGIAIYNYSYGKITVSGDAKVTSANSYGTIYIANSNTATATRLEITGGTVENTTENSNAVYNASTGSIILSGNPAIIGTIMKAGTGITSADGSFNPSSGKIYKLGFTSLDGGGVAVKDGAFKFSFFSAAINGFSVSLTAQSNDLVLGAITNGYAVENSETTYTITKGTGNYAYIQEVIDYIRKQANGKTVTIQFGDGEEVLDIGTEYITFDGTTSLSPVWGGIILTGKITSAIGFYSYGTIYLTNGASIASTADIANTSGTAVYNASTGTVSITGGLVFAYGSAISSVIYGTYNIPSGNPAIIAWSNTGTTYTAFTNSNITTAPTATTAKWLNKNGSGGIDYANGANTGFIPISSITVNKANQAALTINSPATHTFGTDYTLETSGGTTNGLVTYSITGGTGNGEISGHTLTIAKAGTFTITATMAGDDNYNAATSEEFTLTVSKGSGLANNTSPVNPISASNVSAHTFDLHNLALNHSDHGTLSYTLGTFTDGSNILATKPTLNGDKHTITYTGIGKESGNATLEIIVTSENYNDITATIIFNATPKLEVAISGLTVQNYTYDGTPKRGVAGDATSGIYTGDLLYEYSGMDIENFTTTQPTHAGEYILRVSVPDTAHYTGRNRYDFTIEKAKISKPATPAALTYNGSEQTAAITLNAAYTITNNKGTDAKSYTAKVALNDKANYEWTDGSEGDFELGWTIAKAAGTFVNPQAINTTYTHALKLSDLALPAGYAWNVPTTALNAGNNQTFAATYTNPNGNYTNANGTITVNVAKAIGLVNDASPMFSISGTHTHEHTYDLHTLAFNIDKAYLGTLNYALGTFTNSNNILAATPTLIGTTLSYIGTGETSGTATLKITVTSQNYADIEVLLTFNATPKQEVAIGGLTVQNYYVYDGTPKKGYTGIATSEDYIGELLYEYAGTNHPQSTTPPTNAGEYTLRITVPPNAPYTGEYRHDFTIEKAPGTTFVTTSAFSATYSPTLTLANITLPANYAWIDPTTSLNAGDEQNFYATYTDPSGNYTFALGTITVNVARATFFGSPPAALNTTYTPALKLWDLTLPSGYYWNYWINQLTLNAGNGQSFHAIYIDPSGNYNQQAVTITVNVAKATGLVNDAPVHRQISASNSETHTYDLSILAFNIDKAYLGALSYTLGAFSDADGILAANPTLNGTILSFKGAGKTSGTATQKVTVTSQNYEDITVTITFEATGKLEVAITGITAQNYVYNGTPKKGYIGTPFSGDYTGTLLYEYAGTNYPQTTTPPTNAGKYTIKISLPSYASYIGVWSDSFDIAKATPTPATPTGLTATVGQTLADIVSQLPVGWAWADATSTYVGAVGNQTHKANFTPTDSRNFNTLTDVDVIVQVAEAPSSSSVDTTPSSSSVDATPSSSSSDTTPSSSSVGETTPSSSSAGKTPIFSNRENPRIGVQTIANTILLENLPSNAKVEVYNLQGRRIYSAYPENPLILRIWVQTGVYVIKIGTKTTRVAVK